MTELTLDEDRAGIRDRLVTAMKDHAAALRALHTLTDPAVAERDASVEAYIAQRNKALKDVDAARSTCLSAMQTTAHVVGGSGEPRRVTVTVKPKWGSLKNLSGGQNVEFGSGFVVRWQTFEVKTETRIVTNNHVMDGAFEAEIISGDPEFANNQNAKTGNDVGWTATLIQASPHEDVAILRLDPKAVKFSQGVRFRLKPAVEQEQVVAAGFPGVGVRPSFQVTRGIVSNAKFGESESDDAADTYVQHTAAIDPGNSGGPLLDGDGELLGMNTMKLVGRENVGLAVPTSQIQQAMIRAEEQATFDIKHAQASCNATLGALTSVRPLSDSMSRFGIAIFDANKDNDGGKAANYRSLVQGSADNPVEEARLRAYGFVRAMVEAEGGVRPFEVCSKMTVVDAPAAVGRRFLSTIKTRTKDHVLVFGEENAAIRLLEIR
jgi:S1-C subfamily serine protease